MCNILDKNKQRRYIAFNHGNFKAWYTTDHLKTLYAQTSKIYYLGNKFSQYDNISLESYYLLFWTLNLNEKAVSFLSCSHKNAWTNVTSSCDGNSL